jgi:hypothetical protein
MTKEATMKSKVLTALLMAAALGASAGAFAANTRGFGLEVLVDGRPRPELVKDGRLYIEALKGKEFCLRLTNPLDRRAAVALSVDGLNTIDASHKGSREAMKWVLDPGESVIISGWQVSGREARRFYFTGEKHSYGAWLGKTEDLGIIEAVFYAEKVPEPCIGGIFGGSQDSRSREQAPASAPEARSPSQKKSESPLSDEYAATGIGRRLEHRVQRVSLDLEAEPCARISMRYEFRPQLVALGVLPPRTLEPMTRRERASGFDDRFCPDPRRR